MEETMKKIQYNIMQLEKDISNLQNGVSIIPNLNDSDIQLVETQTLNIISIRILRINSFCAFLYFASFSFSAIFVANCTTNSFSELLFMINKRNRRI